MKKALYCFVLILFSSSHAMFQLKKLQEQCKERENKQSIALKQDELALAHAVLRRGTIIKTPDQQLWKFSNNAFVKVTLEDIKKAQNQKNSNSVQQTSKQKIKLAYFSFSNDLNEKKSLLFKDNAEREWFWSRGTWLFFIEEKSLV